MRLSETDRITALLTDYLDVQSRRAEIVASNLANVDTPGFKAKELDFADYLQAAAEDAVTRPSENSLLATLKLSPRVVEQSGTIPGIDGNTVDSGREMTTLSDAGMQFLTGTQMLQARFRALRAAIREGR